MMTPNKKPPCFGNYGKFHGLCESYCNYKEYCEKVADSREDRR
jgi:hypothetical protein